MIVHEKGKDRQTLYMAREEGSDSADAIVFNGWSGEFSHMLTVDHFPDGGEIETNVRDDATF